MYGKSYQSKYEGSMVGAGFNVFAVWDYCITKNRGGIIELNPKLVAFVLAGGGKEAEEKVAEAIEFLATPDPGSRSKLEDGRRLVREGEFQYRMVNWAAYEGIRSIEGLREYNRQKQAEYRAKEREKKRLRMLRKGKPLRLEEDLIRRVESGEITQEQADAIAAETRELPPKDDLPEGLQ